MKLHALCASAVALTLALISPVKAVEFDNRRGNLDNNTTGFVVMATASAMLILKCNYESIDGALAKGADRMGVDISTYGPAVANALMAIAELQYDRSLLMPEVTKTVRWTLDGFFKEYSANPKKTCSSWAEGPAGSGFVRKAR